ncbi:MAG TPA: hypothetical protein VK002_01275 [Rubricoccaceae bacterium]|nr:hypothetical protein [Rubricoccaceae bacterium]
MAAQGNNAMRLGIQIVLAVVIVVGAWYLYRTITEPWEAYQREQRATTMTRARMDHIRTALIEYRDQTERYPRSLDTLVTFVKTDSVFQTEDLSEVFPLPPGASFNPDSLPFSPRTGTPFIYDVVRNDSTGVEIYYLQDPDVPEDYIGAREPDPARRNAASWE